VVVGALSFRYGLKGSYFALVTLAFAEVFRIGHCRCRSPARAWG
jgi:ABC-type branched-subunit amino acid transport system permease subunit